MRKRGLFDLGEAELQEEEDVQYPGDHFQSEPEIILEEKSAWDHETEYATVLFTCYHCSKQFEKQNFLRDHIGKHHMKKSDLLIEEQVRNNSAYNSIVVEPPILETHQCSLCNYKTHLRYNLKLHLVSKHAKEKPHHCTFCNYETVRSNNLKRHIFTMHTENNKLFHCSDCDFKTAHAESLKKHVQGKHLREKPYKCDFCDYRALQRTYLKQHIISIHKSEKLHRCPFCNFRTAKLTNLSYHITVKHTQDAYKNSSVTSADLKKLPT